MKITRTLAAAGMAGALAVTGFAVVAPAAAATTDDDTTTSDSRPGRAQTIADALAGLVSDGTLTQAQADEVATTLSESTALRGPGGHGHGAGAFGAGFGLEAAAEALGLTTDELRTALAVDGTSLADVAATQGVATSDLVDALVAAHTERITEAVTDGRLTQAEADERIAALPERIAAQVEEEWQAHGPRGSRLGAPDDTATDGTDESTADDAA